MTIFIPAWLCFLFALLAFPVLFAFVFIALIIWTLFRDPPSPWK